MYSRILVLSFPPKEVQRPIVCILARDYNLTFNILNAKIFPRREGVMVLELSGEQKDFQAGLKYLRSQGVKIKSAKQEVRRDEDQCIQCGACTAVCPTGALYIERPEMRVVFDQQKCSVCELCVPACPTRAMIVRAKKQSLEAVSSA